MKSVRNKRAYFRRWLEEVLCFTFFLILNSLVAISASSGGQARLVVLICWWPTLAVVHCGFKRPNFECCFVLPQGGKLSLEFFDRAFTAFILPLLLSIPILGFLLDLPLSLRLHAYAIFLSTSLILPLGLYAHLTSMSGVR